LNINRTTIVLNIRICLHLLTLSEKRGNVGKNDDRLTRIVDLFKEKDRRFAHILLFLQRGESM